MKTLSLKKTTPRVESMRKEVAKISAPTKTPSAADQQQAARIARRQQVRRYKKYLMKTYPVAFNFDDPKPLAIGTHQQLLKTRPEGITAAAVKLTMHEWSKRAPYQDALQLGADRVDIDGKPAGTVTEEQITYKERGKKPPSVSQPKITSCMVDE